MCIFCESLYTCNSIFLILFKNNEKFDKLIFYLDKDLFIKFNIMESIMKSYKIKKLKKENIELKKENIELKEDNRISSEIFEDQYIQFKNRNNLNWW